MITTKNYVCDALPFLKSGPAKAELAEPAHTPLIRQALTHLLLVMPSLRHL